HAEPDQIGGAQPADEREELVRREQHGAEARGREREIEGVAGEDAERRPPRRGGAARQRLRDHEEDGRPRRQAQQALREHEQRPHLETHSGPSDPARSRRWMRTVTWPRQRIGWWIVTSLVP